MSTEVEEYSPAGGDAVVEDLPKNDHELDSRQNDDKPVDEPELEQASPVREEEVRSRHSSISSASSVTEPVEEHHQEPVAEPIVEPKKHEPVVHPVDENYHNEESYAEDGLPKKIRPVVHPDFAQSQQSVKKEVDENDWAIKNKNCGKIKNLISMFNTGTVLNEQMGNSGSTYKTDYGVGQSGKKIRQDVFH